MRIVIPTYRRMPRQSTLLSIPRNWLSRTCLVLDEADYELRGLYDTRGVQLIVHPPEISTIAKKRAWIIRTYGLEWGKLVMFDDDLRFSVRIRSGDTALRQSEESDMEHHLEQLEAKLNEYDHVGWSPRQGNNRLGDGWKECARMMYVLGYDAEAIRILEDTGAIELGRIETREDMDLALQLLRIGHPNAISCDIAADQVGGFAAKGGCETQRTLESSNADALKLEKLHPGLVKAVAKEYKGSTWDRLEVVVQWKKAYEEGCREGH